MKILRPQDAGGIPVEALHRLGLAMPGVISPTTEGISIRGRGGGPARSLGPTPPRRFESRGLRAGVVRGRTAQSTQHDGFVRSR